MSNDDFYDRSARQRYQILEAAKARCIANLEEFKANGDDYSAQEELQTLATLRDQQESLSRLHAEYHQRLNPPAQRPPTEKEREARAPESMTVEDVEAIFQKSKYAKDFSFRDPEVQKSMNHNHQEWLSRQKSKEWNGR